MHLLAICPELNTRFWSDTIIDQATEPWGIKVSVVEVKNVDLPRPLSKESLFNIKASSSKNDSAFTLSTSRSLASSITLPPITVNFQGCVLVELGAHRQASSNSSKMILRVLFTFSVRVLTIKFVLPGECKKQRELSCRGFQLPLCKFDRPHKMPTSCGSKA
jgi:hypothetical protein